MRVGFISDIHANYAALRCVADHLEGSDAVYACGDAVGYGSEPNEVCEFLQEHGVQSVMGNHDAMVLGELPEVPERENLYRTGWTRQQLSPSNRQWLESLPVERSIQLEGWSVKIRHASPWDLTTYLYPDSSRLPEAVPTDDSVLVVGHTHRPLVVTGRSGVLVNCGSVGQPRGGALGFQYTEFRTEAGVWVQRTVLAAD